LEILNEILNIIKQSNKIIVAGHIMPDGDCISSVLSLSLALEKIGKDVLPIIDYNIPYQYLELAEIRKIKKVDEVIEEISEYDLVIILDSSSVDRIGRLKDFLEGKKKVVIDHHVTNDRFGDINWVDDSFSSTAQMIYMLNQTLGVKYDSRLSTINLMGIATDTGFFRYPNTTPEVFKDAYELSKTGGEIWVIAQMILENNRPERLKLFAGMIENMEFLLDGKFVHSIIRYEDFKKLNCTEEDSSGFVGELRAIKGVEVAALIVEYPKGKVHVSIRSKNEFDVSTVASELGGGGHPRAAGCTFESTDPDEIRRIIVSKISEALNNRC